MDHLKVAALVGRFRLQGRKQHGVFQRPKCLRVHLQGVDAFAVNGEAKIAPFDDHRPIAGAGPGPDRADKRAQVEVRQHLPAQVKQSPDEFWRQRNGHGRDDPVLDDFPHVAHRQPYAAFTHIKHAESHGLVFPFWMVPVTAASF
jgi:hypothetical protein